MNAALFFLDLLLFLSLSLCIHRLLVALWLELHFCFAFVIQSGAKSGQNSYLLSNIILRAFNAFETNAHFILFRTPVFLPAMLFCLRCMCAAIILLWIYVYNLNMNVRQLGEVCVSVCVFIHFFFLFFADFKCILGWHAWQNQNNWAKERAKLTNTGINE